ncbi:MAG: TonB-dependent receptor domain-containing protein [bacterium]
MILKQLILTLTLICASSFCFTQEVNLTGRVLDNSNQPLPYVNIVVTDSENNFLTGTTSNEDGNYELTLTSGNVSLTYSFIGFKTVTTQLEVSSDLILDTITLYEDVESLGEVTVVAKKPTIKREADRLVFDVANTALTEGSVLQVLKSTPSVLVLGDKIQIKNNTPVVYINNKRVQLSTTEVLQLLESTSASSIKSVEVITNPPASYDADSGVVLNIVMDKNVVAGYSGSVYSNFEQGVFPKWNYGMTNFFKGKKLSLYASYNYADRKVNRFNREEIDYFDENGVFDQGWLSNLNRNTWSETHTANINLDYDFDDRNTLSLSSNLLFLPYFKYVINNKTFIDDPDNALNSQFSSNNLSRDYKQNLAYDLGYQHTFKNAATIGLNGHYTSYNYNRSQEVQSDFNGPLFEEIETAFNTFADQDIEIITAQIDFKQPIKKNGNFEVGAKASGINSESSIDQFDIINGQSVFNTENSDAFDYEERVYAGYISLDKEWSKFQLSLGLRAEQTNVEGVSLNQTNTQDYLKWFPTVSLSHDISDKNNIYTTYKRSIQRPDYNLLNPFQFFLNDNTIVTGNPNLQPVFTDHATIGISFNDTFVFESYYKSSDNSIFEIPLQDNNTNIITYSPVNLSKTIEYGFDFLGYFNLTERISLYAVTSFYYTQDTGTFGGTTVDQDIWANYSELSSNLSLLKDNSFNITLALVYSSRNLQGFQLVERDQYYSDIAITKTILKGKGVISLSASDLLNLQDFDVRTRFLDQNSRLFTDLDNRYVRLGFRYKFGNTNLTTNQRSLEKEERDRLNQRN